MKVPLPLRPRINLRALKPALLDNVGLKLLALLCSFVIYGFVHGAQEAQRNMAVDLVALLPPDAANRILVTPLPPTVRVTIHGPRTLLDGLRPEELGTFQVDLRSARSGRVPLEPSMIGSPPGTTITMIDPQSLDVVWDDLVEREIPLQITVAGEPAEGFVVKGSPDFNPRTVHARGPKQVFDGLQAARAEPFDVTGLAEGVHQRTIAIDRPPQRVSFDTNSTTVTLEIARRLADRVFRAVQVHVIGAPRAVAFPARVDVRVVGPPDLVKPLRQEQIVPRIDLKEIGADLSRPNSMAVPITFDVEGCKTSITPASVIVKW